jgi:hypothetical protein
VVGSLFRDSSASRRDETADLLGRKEVKTIDTPHPFFPFAARQLNSRLTSRQIRPNRAKSRTGNFSPPTISFPLIHELELHQN